jgi:hypothetical protein
MKPQEKQIAMSNIRGGTRTENVYGTESKKQAAENHVAIDVTVRVNYRAPADDACYLTEAQLVGYLQAAARSTGAIEDAAIPELMALYGWMRPMDFHNEIRRKMRLTKEGDFAEHHGAGKEIKASGRLSTIKQASLEKGELVFFDGGAAEHRKPEAGPGVYRIAQVWDDETKNTRGQAVLESDLLWLCDPEDSDRIVLAIVRADSNGIRGLRQSNRYEGIDAGSPVCIVGEFMDDFADNGAIAIVERAETRDGEVHEDDDVVIIRTHPDRGVESLHRLYARALWALRQDEYDLIVDSRKPAVPAFEKGALVYFGGSNDAEGVRAGVYRVGLIYSPADSTVVDRPAGPGDEVWLESGLAFDLTPIKVPANAPTLRALSTYFDSRMIAFSPRATVFIRDGTGEYDLGTIHEIETEDLTVCNETDIVMVKVDLPDGREIYLRFHAENLWPLTQEEFDAITAGRSNPSPEEGAPTP